MSVPKMRLGRLIRASSLVTAALIGVALLLSGTSFLGYRSLPVLSGSMEPVIPRGSLLIAKRQPAERYRVGDIATFRVPFKGNFLVAHRLTGLSLNERGVWTVSTKGDANSSGDAWSLSLGNLEGKAVTAIPYAGYLVAWTKTSFGFLAFVLLSFFLCVLGEMRWLAETWGRKPMPA